MQGSFSHFTSFMCTHLYVCMGMYVYSLCSVMHICISETNMVKYLDRQQVTILDTNPSCPCFICSHTQLPRPVSCSHQCFPPLQFHHFKTHSGVTSEERFFTQHNTLVIHSSYFVYWWFALFLLLSFMVWIYHLLNNM